MSKLKAGILGASGAAGMEFVRALHNHPYFEIAELYGNASAGSKLEDTANLTNGELNGVRELLIKPMGQIARNLDIICSALPSNVARSIEAECFEHTPVISTASAYRYEPNVPVIITEINSGHYKLLDMQNANAWVAPGPNCTTVGLAMSLYPIYREFGIKHVTMTSYQSVSGAGKENLDLWESQKKVGLPMPLEELQGGLVFDGNVIPFIKDEEAKVQKETLKILGDYKNNSVTSANFAIDCICARVPVVVGHLESVFVETYRDIDAAGAIEAYHKFNKEAYAAYGHLPSSPKNFITLADVPEPRLHVNLDGGMTAVIGRIEKTDRGIKYAVLSNNLQRGAAKGIVHVAEYLYSIGYLKRK